MKNAFFIGIVAALFFASCTNKDPVSIKSGEDPGSANISIAVGKVGVLGKRKDISLVKLCIRLSAPGEYPIFDTVQLSGSGPITVNETYSNLAALKDWTLFAKTLDTQDSVIHSGSTTCKVLPRQAATANLDLGALYSMLKAKIYPIRDSVTRCQLLVNGIVKASSSFAKQSLIGDTVRLAFDYLKTNTPQRITMNAFGDMYGFDTLLYAGDSTINSSPGASDRYVVSLKWVGPSKPPAGQASMSVAIGEVGTTNVEGQIDSLKPYLLKTISVGTGPTGVGVNPGTNRVYVSNTTAGTVSVIDGNSNDVITTIAVGASPNGITANPLTNLVYVAQSIGAIPGLVYVIDGTPGSSSENTVIATITASGRFLASTNELAVNPSTNLIYVPSFDPGGAMVVVDGATQTLWPHIAVSANPLCALFNPLTNKIYVGHGAFFGRRNLTIINGADQSVSDGPTVGLSTRYLALDTVLNRIYVEKGDLSRSEPNGIVFIDGSTDAVIGTVTMPTLPMSVGVNPATHHVFIGSESNKAYWLDGTGSPGENSVRGNVTLTGTPTFIAVNPTSNLVYVTSNTANVVSVIVDR